MVARVKKSVKFIVFFMGIEDNELFVLFRKIDKKHFRPVFYHMRATISNCTVVFQFIEYK